MYPGVLLPRPNGRACAGASERQRLGDAPTLDGVGYYLPSTFRDEMPRTSVDVVQVLVPLAVEVVVVGDLEASEARAKPVPSDVGTESSAESEKVAMIITTAGRLPATGSTSPRILASSPVFCMLHCDFFMALLSLLCYRSRLMRLAWPVSFSLCRRVAALRRRSTAVPRVRCSLSPRVTAHSRRGVPGRAPFQPLTPLPLV